MYAPGLRGNWSAEFLDYVLPRTPGGFRRLSEISVGTKQPSCRYSRKTVFSRAPVDFRRKPEPVPRTQVLSYPLVLSLLLLSLSL